MIQSCLSGRNEMGLSNSQRLVAEISDQKLPSDLPGHMTATWLQKTSADIARCLKLFGIAVINNFLGSQLGEKILREVSMMINSYDISFNLFV